LNTTDSEQTMTVGNKELPDASSYGFRAQVFSEFVAERSLVLLSIILRQTDSPEPQPVDAPNMQTGD